MKKFFILFLLLNLFCINVYAQEENDLEPSLSRMEREWFHKEFNKDNDEMRLERLEEKVFGTVHDVDKKVRYHQLQKAFDAKKMMQAQNRKNHFYGTPTSVPINVDDLIR